MKLLKKVFDALSVILKIIDMVKKITDEFAVVNL